VRTGLADRKATTGRRMETAMCIGPVSPVTRASPTTHNRRSSINNIFQRGSESAYRVSIDPLRDRKVRLSELEPFPLRRGRAQDRRIIRPPFIGRFRAAKRRIFGRSCGIPNPARQASAALRVGRMRRNRDGTPAVSGLRTDVEGPRGQGSGRRRAGPSWGLIRSE
jgi:hypothetical protein